MTTPVRWPNGARCAIMMTFDLDGESPWIQRDPALADRHLHMSMGSYGPKTGMPRVLDLLDRYDIKTCIFIPGWIVERYPALCEEIVRRGHEVGQHGYLHERPSSLKGRDDEEVLLVKSHEEGGFYNGLGHPQIIGRPSRMRMVERLVQRMLGKKDVWWPKPIDLAKFWLEKNQGSAAR